MIYLDNAATTPVSPEVLGEMLPFLRDSFGNPSALYRAGRESREAIAVSRERISRLIGASSREIFFTSGGTEADNWALVSTFEALRDRGNHIITMKIEHPAVLRTCAYLEKTRGARVTYLPVDSQGFVRPEDVRDAIGPDTILVSVMTANNEIGTLEPIREIGEITRSRGVLFHTDAVQAFGQIPLKADELGVDLLSASAHKLHGPKGCGCLYVRRGTPVRAFLHGGSQEYNRRAGTENVPGIAGFGKAAEIAMNRLLADDGREAALRDELIRGLLDIPGSMLNGSPKKRLPGNVNVSFSGISAEALLIVLDRRGIAASAGSACASGSLSPSHVLTAIGLSEETARSTVRFSLSDETTEEDIRQAAEIIRGEVLRMRGR
jgi:cysteine desulfurase